MIVPEAIETSKELPQQVEQQELASEVQKTEDQPRQEEPTESVEHASEKPAAEQHEKLDLENVEEDARSVDFDDTTLVIDE